MKNYKKIVVEKIEDGHITLEITLKSSRIWHMTIDESKVEGEIKEDDLLTITKEGKFKTLTEETDKEKERIQEKLNRLFKKK